MKDILEDIFGVGEDLNILQMTMRALVMFFIALILIRISGRRSFGAGSAFDNIVVIMLGAILSRAVVGASPFLPTVAAGIMISTVHRLLALLASRSHAISVLLKGRSGCLYKDGELIRKNLRRFNLSLGDIEQGLRAAGNTTTLEDVKEVWMERSGEITVIK